MPIWILTSYALLFGRATPRELPSSVRALVEAAVLYTAISTVDAALVFHNARAFGFGVADLAFTVLVTALCLWIRRRMHRLEQTVLAMLGVGIWLTLPSIVINWSVSLSAPTDSAARMPLVPELVLAAMLCWSILTVARIMRDALDLDFFTGMTVSMTYFLADYLCLVALPARWLS